MKEFVLQKGSTVDIIRLNYDTFRTWECQIEKLINDSVKINFYDQPVSDGYGAEKCDEIKAYLQKDAAIIYAAVEGGELLGWVWCHPITRLVKRRLHISEIGVAETCQGRGIGQKLLAETEAYARDNGFEEIDLFVTASNERAVDFYKKSSYIPERFLMKKIVR